MRKSKSAASIVLVVLLCIYVVAPIVTAFIGISLNKLKSSSNSKFVDISDKWYQQIEYQGYIEYLDEYEYIVYWYEMTDVGATERYFKVVSLKLEPSEAIKFIEENPHAFLERGFETSSQQNHPI